MSNVMKIVGDRIRAIRKERKLSQMELGELADLHHTYIGRIERGENNVTIKSLEKVAFALGVSFDELFRFIQPIDQGKDAHYLSRIVNNLQGRKVSDHKRALEILELMLEWKDE